MANCIGPTVLPWYVRMAPKNGGYAINCIGLMDLPWSGQMAGKNGGCVVKTSHLGRLHGWIDTGYTETGRVWWFQHQEDAVQFQLTWG